MSLQTELQTMINNESTLATNKVANFCYEDTALENPQQYAESVADYDFERPNNIPNTSTDVLKINETVLTKGFRSQASSITRMLVNHFFGRVSYNLNLTVTTFNNLLTQFKNYLGAPNGVATLDANGRVPASQLPETAIEFKGTWDASTNTTSAGANLINGTGTKGDLYLCSTEGWFNASTGQSSSSSFEGAVQYFVNDRIVYDGSTWNRLSSGDIQRVNGLSPSEGNVQLTYRLTLSQYNALTSDEKKGKYFVITDIAGEDWFQINDEAVATDTLWSSSKTNTEIQAVKDVVPSDATSSNQLVSTSTLNGALTNYPILKKFGTDSNLDSQYLQEIILNIIGSLTQGTNIVELYENNASYKKATVIVSKVNDNYFSYIATSFYFTFNSKRYNNGTWID